MSLWSGEHDELHRIRFRDQVSVLTSRNGSGGCMGKDEPVLNRGHPIMIEAWPMARAYKPYMPQLALEVYAS